MVGAGVAGAEVTGDLPRPADGLEMFRTVCARSATQSLISYFDAELTAATVDHRSSALATALREDGFEPGDRLAILTQNDPAFVVAILAAWKLGGVAVPVNPMYTERELAFLLIETETRALVCLEEEFEGVPRSVIDGGDTEVATVVLIDREAALFAEAPELADGEFQPHPISSTDPALLMYTSGTTGVPKAAVITHANVTASAEIYRLLMSLTDADIVLAISPLFHITGMIGHVAVAFRTGARLVLAHRFAAEVMIEQIRRHRPTFIVGTVTALVAVVHASTGPEDFASVRSLHTGGAPVSREVADLIEAGTGQSLNILYGLTETTSPAIATPMGEPVPVDAESGAMAIGLPVPATVCRVVDVDGRQVAAGEVGEIELRGPQVIGGYWRAGEDTADIVDGALRTGDIGFVDESGWIFLLDRRKDMITTAGYKVWPREVEEVLARHPAVAEAVVVGMPDETRGEEVTAFVTVRSGRTVTPAELIDFSRTQLAAYKRPRRIRMVRELPKSPTGKVLRRELRGENYS